MEETKPHESVNDSHSGMASLWAGVIGAPIVWATDTALKYMLVPWVCQSRHFWVLYLISVTGLALVGAAGFLCWREWRSVGHQTPETSEFGTHARVQFLGALGLLISAMSFLLILLSAVPGLIIDPCVD